MSLDVDAAILADLCMVAVLFARLVWVNHRLNAELRRRREADVTAPPRDATS